MKKVLLFIALFLTARLFAQVEPGAGSWKPWFLGSAKEVKLPAPPGLNATKEEVGTILAAQGRQDSAQLQRIFYWSTGAPSYRWRDILLDAVASDTTGLGSFLTMLLHTAVYDAMVAAWDVKYTHKRLRPFEQDKRVKALVVQLNSPSYPCEYSVAAGVATTLVAHFFPQKMDSVKRLAQEAMQSRVAAGVQYVSDTRAGFELGQSVARKAIDFLSRSEEPRLPASCPWFYLRKQAGSQEQSNKQ